MDLTRREWLARGGAVALAGVAAGCSSGSGDSGATDETTTGGTHSASMAPVGEVTFEEVPSDLMVYSLNYADMAVAYGHGDGVNSLGFDADAGGRTLDAYYERLDGVSFDREGLTQLNSGSGSIKVDKEVFFDLQSDLHLADPALVTSFDGWKRSDVEDVRENVGPWFGNIYSRAHGTPPTSWQDDYEYYTLWEIAERVAAVFREGGRYADLKAVHDDVLSTIESNLPPESERPSVASVILMDGTFYPSTINTPGFGNAHVRPLGATDVFAENPAESGAVGYEALLERDPDVILHQFSVASYYDVAAKRSAMESHAVGSRITAVDEGRVYASGNPVQGPLMNLFQLEMTAKQLYPEQFGTWPGYTAGEPYPEIPEDERLFDRDRVASIVADS
ncbi:MAG: ABC transporter substrate-binding protein [Halobacteriaceae archaeon]